MKKLLILLLMVMLIGGCSPETAPAKPVVPTQAFSPTDTPQPTETRRPSPTFRPSKTQKPTNTRWPTSTPTKMPASVVITGTGSDVIDAENPYGPAVVHITGNSGGRYFGVKNFDANNEIIDLLVNTTDPYDGYRPLDFVDGDQTVRFQIEAIGDWTIEIIPMISAHILRVPGYYNGNGDDVVFLIGLDPDTMIVRGNDDGRYFGIFGYDSRKHVLVNTTDPYDGKVLLTKYINVLEINAIGDWYIEIAE